MIICEITWLWLIVMQGQMAIGTMWWMLAREVLRLRGTISRDHPWDVMVDLYFYRDPEEVRFRSMFGILSGLRWQKAHAVLHLYPAKTLVLY
jgi:hypothetical protein